MNAFSGFVVYVMIYWTLLFAILPWGNKAPDVPEEGMAGSAPINPRLKQKFIITGILSAILWLAVFILIKMDVIDFYDIARQMSQEDLQK